MKTPEWVKHPIYSLKLWLLKKNTEALEQKVYNGTATKADYELLDRFGRYHKVLTQVR